MSSLPPWARPVPLLVVLWGCGGSSPTPTSPTPATSFLTGTWTGTVTIQVNPGDPAEEIRGTSERRAPVQRAEDLERDHRAEALVAAPAVLLRPGFIADAQRLQGQRRRGQEFDLLRADVGDTVVHDCRLARGKEWIGHGVRSPRT